MSTQFWDSDWDNPDDAIYDGPDAEQQAAYAKRMAMREYMELSQQIENELIAEMGWEEYEASQHWINNPLIKPRSKVSLFEQWEERIRREEREHSVELLESQLGVYGDEADVTADFGLQVAISLIRGEKND